MHGWTGALRRRSRLGVCVSLAASMGALAACEDIGAVQRGAVSSTASTSTVTTAPPVTAPTVKGRVHEGAALTSTGIVVPVLGPAEEGDGWVVGTPCGRTAVVDDARPLSGTVVLDPGHGGKETGAVGPLGHTESDINLAVVAYAQRALKDAGITAIPTRTRDYRIAIASRAAIVTAVKPKAVVSVHHNAAPSHLQATPGTEIFYQQAGTSTAESKRLAGLLYEEVTATLSQLGLTEWAATPRPGAKHRRSSTGDDFYGILRRTQGTPTALTEVGFISHEAEERRFAEPAVQEQVGKAIARGVVRFLTTTDPGSGFVVPPNLADDARNSGGTANCVDPPLS